ncbi:TMPS9 protease, partial [Amia calva]|nr:TMPS9 protease [Amia calva]
MPDQSGQNRILGGQEAMAHSWPWQVVLRAVTTPVCGGAIINRYWVLSASHCFRLYRNPVFWKVLAGKHDLDDSEEECQQIVGIDRIVLHEGYVKKTHENDIALLKLKEPLVFNLCVRPIFLPTQELKFPRKCAVTGWGTTSESGPRAWRLQEVNITVIDSDTCNWQFYNGKVTDSMICAGEPTGGKDACQGDSGGPMSCENEEHTFELSGVVSWGVGCGRPDKPGVYTNVLHFVEWIKTNMQAVCGTGSTEPCGLNSGLAKVILSDEGQTVVENVSEACENSWPWLVSLQHDGEHCCTGTLIDPGWVLARRHCSCSSITAVVLGTYDFKMPGQSIPVSDNISPLDSTGTHPLNDLTLIRLQTPPILDGSVIPVCLPDDSVILDDTWSCLTVGWGSSNYTMYNESNILHQANLEMVNTSSCAASWGEDILEIHVCAGAAGSESCMGISGGPLICQKDGVFSLFGVLTWGSEICNADKPAIYTMVSAYIPWINDVIHYV